MFHQHTIRDLLNLKDKNPAVSAILETGFLTHKI